MACCVFAAFLVAQISFMVRRWGQFWGLVPVSDGESMETVFDKIQGFARKPGVRLAVICLLGLEAVALGAWIYVDHGGHIVHIFQSATNGVEGVELVNVMMCTSDGSERSVPISLK